MYKYEYIYYNIWVYNVIEFDEYWILFYLSDVFKSNLNVL